MVGEETGKHEQRGPVMVTIKQTRFMVERLPIDRVIGRRLAGVRIARNLRQVSCARSLGLTEGELLAVEQGRRPLLARELYCAAVRLQAPLAEFFTGLEPAPPTRWYEGDEEEAVRRLVERFRALPADIRRILASTIGVMEEQLLRPILLAELPDLSDALPEVPNTPLSAASAGLDVPPPGDRSSAAPHAAADQPADPPAAPDAEDEPPPA